MELDKLFQKFCSQDIMRPIMIEPFIQKNYIYAVDGFKAIRIPIKFLNNHNYTNIDNQTIFNITKCYDELLLTNNINSIYITIQIENILNKFKHENVYKQVPCELCDGKGYCPHCEQDCPKCYGSGKIDSPKIIDQQYSPGQFVAIKESFFDPNYVKLLLEAALIEKTNEIKFVVGEKNKKHLFKINNIEILLMPASITKTATLKWGLTVLELTEKTQKGE